MKKLITLLSLTLCIGFTHAQWSIESNFNSVQIGRNQNILFQHSWDRLSINFGAKYNFNKLVSFPRPQHDIFKKAFWAESFDEHIGLETGLHFKILDREKFNLFGFYQCQLSRSHTRIEGYYPIGSLVPEPQSEYDLVYQRHLGFVGPILAMENNIGIGLDIHFTDRFYLTQKAGTGLVLFRNTDPNNIIVSDGGLWEFAQLLSVGAGWYFSSPSK
ncbi:MAG: hypothetical protein MI810_25145 [Flavobacteriales bacterium]|nr:hypothetical protein [Flavobacteriales bacterium]